ncbi:putative NADH:ubiquinone reductase (non-electrogenic) [Helianthus annuus]|uniref:Internal alternative NAD(P)H-ubiquinone oxidoreductase A1, mitochondrial n=1 Tax=Helianthus annuus TaxID=4232 RepID=A0A251S0T1_HELAN|nr:internal alternative NAD(P)H-ubiquinone oxidoreductase A1, mitochondrial [Helianthus annuus]XP_022016903.1 internal alternative NAD(P)H-ubiquinone oxidoreductase A1, mitochondrial [Helianthus annuus]KAF5760654.1 putative NADH:ubiquinone reductase (non-electrogenic) [Helianthus annuus]KAJ0438648.1 putative NADH:ubiquinone reductase (non-electrogenic) [Helianthus annuus]KAJ0443495.1 putative NADH:ubiquinone reductase (non-electrogenic) [Helianthus annuus]KAJ0460994.1 putative NADH:ubiquinone 
MALARLSRNWKQSSGTYAINRCITDKDVPFNAEAVDKMLYVQTVRKVDHMKFQSNGTRAVQGYRFAHAERVSEDYSDSRSDKFRYGNLEATKSGDKPRVVVLGTGWAACRFLKGIDTTMYNVVCISPRNHMVFTPLLASTCVGTLEFRSVAEPVVRVQTALAKDPNSYFYLASCTSVDTDKHEVYCETVSDNENLYEPYRFKVAYDKLVIASGSEPLTFGIKGVKEHALFLREVSHAQEIRKRLLLNLMLSETPGISEEEKEQMLHCVVIGGGPTGVEFSGELSDFIVRDVYQRYAHVKNYVCVTLIEANEILSSFDVGLRQYATKHLTKYGVRLVRGVVKEVHAKKLILSDGSVVPYGLLVWSTGVGPSEFIKQLQLPKSPGGRIGIDEWLRVPSVEDVFALGDCAGFLEHTGRPVLPALAQVAERQGKYLVELFNKKIGKQNAGRACSANDVDLGDPFVYKHLGSMASVGRYKALVDLSQTKDAKGVSMAGFVSWLIWRSAYLTRVLSWRNRLYVMINWATTLVFGRDNTRIG